MTKHNGVVVFTETITYKGTNGTTSGQVAKLDTLVGTYKYDYDANGNIVRAKLVVDGKGWGSTYAYDSQNQLIRENNKTYDQSWTWEYDNAGNIKAKKEYDYKNSTEALGSVDITVNYDYADSDWGDLLTSWGTKTVTSDAIGNMLSDGTWTYTWEHGRELASMSSSGTTWNFTYDANGMRTARSDGTTEYTYVYNGGQLSRMTIGPAIDATTENTITLDFTYDASGTPLSVNYNGTYYYYVTDLQGDVVAIVDTEGEKVVEYLYDAWGRLLTTGGTQAADLGLHNPLRYRGYVYDPELGLYYLQSRYYDPQVGRFINGDDPGYLGTDGILSYNLFAYCGNNPVMGYDPTGTWDWGTAFSGAGLLATGLTAIATAAAILTCGAAAPVMVAVAAVTAVAGALTAVNGAAEVVEAGTGYNAIRDGVLGGNEQAYEAYRDATLAVAEVGTVICGSYYAAKGGNVCFVEGTLVQSEQGPIPIETVMVGTMVWAWDEGTGDVALKEVIETYINESDELVHIFVNGEEIVCTPSHPFYSPVKGWTDAVQLRAGDILVLVNGEYVVVEKVQHEILEAPVTVFNFQVEDYHTYYVSDVGILVHNSCDYKPLRDGDMRAVINPGELEAPHAHVFQKSNNIGRIFSNGTMDASLLNNRDGMRFVKNHYDEIIALIGDFYGKR